MMFEKKKKQKKEKQKKAFNPKGRIFFLSSLVVVSFLLFAGIGMASATDYYVATGGSDSNTGTSLDQPWQHPSYATQRAQAGDTIYLVDGIWNNEHIVFANSGTADNPIVMKSYDSSKKWTLDGIDKTGTCIEIHGKSYISISDFRIRNYNTGIMGIDLIRHLTISDFTIEDVSTQAIAFDDASLQDSEITDFFIQNTGGISIRRLGWTNTDCHDVTISHFIIRNSANNGIQWRNSQRIHIKHGEIHDTGADGIELLTSVDDSIMEDIKVYNAGWHGLAITDGTAPCYRNTIKDCYVAYAGHNAIDLHTDTYDTLVENCEITGGGSMGAGVYFHNGGEGLIVRGCTIYGDSSVGHTFKGIEVGRPDVLVEDCTLYNLRTAIDACSGDPDDIVIRNNVIYSTTYENAIHISPLNNALIESNTIGGEQYRVNVGKGIIRNGLDTIYSVYAEYGGTITIEYNNGKTFSVDGSGNYATYTFSSGWKRIDVLGEAATGAITGIVTTTTGSPIEGAIVTVEVVGESGGTDSYGVYSIADVPVGTYTVTASAFEYEDTSIPLVEINKDETTTLNFQLIVEPSDTVPPAAVTDLATCNPSSHSITLTWTAPGDDEDTGAASEYDIRYSTSEITEANWGSATQCTGEPTPQVTGSIETFTVAGISPDTAYYFALKTADEVPNLSDISNCASGTTTEAVVELASYWEFDEGSGNTAQDSSGNNNDGTIHGASWTEGKLGTSLSFDGTNDYVDCGRDSSLKITGAITVEAWVKWTGDGNPYFVTKFGAPGYRSYDLSGNRDGTVEFRVGGSDCNTIKSSGSAPIPTGEWVYLVGTYEPSDYVRLFVNGALAKESTTSIPAAQGDNGLSWYIGAREGYVGWFSGIIDEVKIHNGALSAEEIRANYDANPTNNPPAAIIDSITPETAEQGKDNVSFSGHGTDTDGLVVAYNWRSSMDGQLSAASSYSRPATELSAGTHTIYFKVQDDKGAWSTEVTDDLTINQEPENRPPVADLKGPYTGTEGAEIVYDGSGSYDPDGSIVAYEWDFGDGNTATGVAPTHTYAQDGTYTVALTVTDNDGAINMGTTTATIADTEPTADLSASTTCGDGPLTVTFTDNSASYDGIVEWAWDFDNDDVTDSTVQNPTHVYAEDGEYTVSLTVTESEGDSNVITKMDYITVTKVNNAPYVADNPSPSDGATEASIAEVLSWTGGDPDDEDTVTYNVYFGTSINPPLVAENQPETTYDPGIKAHSTEYYWQIIATDNHGASRESEVWSFVTDDLPSPDLVAEWDLDAGSGETAVDTSGNSNDGTLVNNPTWVNGKVGKGLSFDGTNDYVDCGQDASLKITGAITVEAWVKWPGTGNPYFITKFGGPSHRSYDLSGNTDGTVEFRVGGSDCNTIKSSGSISIPHGEWVYLVGTYEPSNYVRLFVNGALAEEDTTSIPASQGDNGLSWYIGAREGYVGWFSGIIDEVKIHNGALSAEEIMANYEANPTNNPPAAIIDSITPETAEQGKETVSFTGHGTDTDGSVVAYNWRSSMDGQLSTASSYSRPATELSAGTHTIYFKVQDDKGAWSTEETGELTITEEPENLLPAADLKGPYTGTEGEQITFDGSASSDPDGSIVAYVWDFGDGNISSAVTATHTYAQEGTYTITLKVTDNEGAINTRTTTATIADTEPTADFYASPTSGDGPLTVAFIDNSTSYDGIETLEWDFDNDGETDSTEQNPTHDYAEEGVYTVSLTVTESDGCSDTMTKTDYITVTEASKIEYIWLEAEDADIITPDFETVSDLSASNGKYIQIPEGVGFRAHDGEANYRITVDSPGDYIVWGSKIAATGGDNSFFVQIDDGTKYLWAIALSDNWQWDAVNHWGSGGEYNPEIDPLVFTLSAGEHTLKIIQREDGAKLDELLITNDMSYVPVSNNPPTAIIDSITPDIAEQGKETVAFSGHGTDTDGSVVAYNWRSDVDGQISTASSFSKPASELSVGTHTIYFTVQDDKGAWSTEVTKDLTLIEPANQAPVADPSGPYTGTEGFPIDYDGSGSYDPDGSIVAYEWDFGDGNTATGEVPTHTYAQEGTYTITLKVTDNEGAINTRTTTATIADTEPTADFYASPTSGDGPLTVAFIDNSTSYDGIETLEWDFDNDGETDSTEQNPTHDYAEEGVYTVSLTVTESDGCSDTMTKTDYITVTEASKIEYIWLEAEDADIITPDFETVSDLSASNGKYIQIPEGVGFRAHDGEANYRITVDSPGDYIVWGSKIAATGGDNSFFVQIDDGTKYLWAIALSDNWQWDAVNHWGSGGEYNPEIDPLVFTLSAGEHTLKIIQREDGAKLDELLITNDMSYVPVSNNPPTAIIDSITPDIAEQGKETVAFSGHGTDTAGSVVAYNWRSDVDGQISTASSFSKPASELSVGTHTIYFTVQDDKGAWSTEVTKDLTLIEPANQAPVADPSGPYTGTEGFPIDYDGSGSYDPDGSIVAYDWDFGDGDTATGVAPTHTYAQNGTYTVTLKVTDNDGATNTITTTATIADTEPTAAFSATRTHGPEPLTVAFTDNSASYDGIETWAWDFDNDGVADSTEQNPTYVYIEYGRYTVILTVTESDGDSGTMTKADYITVIIGKKSHRQKPASVSPSGGATDVPVDED